MGQPRTASEKCLWRAAAAVLSMLTVYSAKPAAGQSVDDARGQYPVKVRPIVEPAIHSDSWAEFCDALPLTADQRAEADQMFAEYDAKVLRLAESVYEKMLEAGYGRESFSRPAREATTPAPDHIIAIWDGVDRVVRRGQGASDQLRRTILTDVRSMLTEEQREEFFPAALRRLNRTMLLHPARRNTHDWRYTGQGVDVTQLIAEASASDEDELAWLDPEWSSPDRSQEDLDLLRDAGREAVTQYEIALDTELTSFLHARREAHSETSRAMVRGDAEAWRRAKDKLEDHHARVRRLNHQLVDQIAQLTQQAVGADEATAWRDRFLRYSYPWIWQTDSPDLMFEWMSKRSLPSERAAMLATAYDEYRARREPLRERMLDAVLEARRMYGLHSAETTDPGNPEAVREALENLRSLANETLGRFRSLLATPEERKAFNAHLSRVRQYDENGWKPDF